MQTVKTPRSDGLRAHGMAIHAVEPACRPADDPQPLLGNDPVHERVDVPHRRAEQPRRAANDPVQHVIAATDLVGQSARSKAPERRLRMAQRVVANPVPAPDDLAD